MATDASIRTAVAKHSLLISGHSTSISLESAFWQRLRHVATARGVPVAALVATIDETRGTANLSSAIRVFLLEEALGTGRRDDPAAWRDAAPVPIQFP